MPTGRLFDDSRNITEWCVTAVYDAMYRVYLYFSADKIGIMILFLSSYIGYLRLRRVKTPIYYDEIHCMLSISGQV